MKAKGPHRSAEAIRAEKRIRDQVGARLVKAGQDLALKLITEASKVADREAGAAKLAGVTKTTLGYEVARVAIQTLLVNGYTALHTMKGPDDRIVKNARKGAYQWLSRILSECGTAITAKTDNPLRLGIEFIKSQPDSPLALPGSMKGLFPNGGSDRQQRTEEETPPEEPEDAEREAEGEGGEEAGPEEGA